MQNQHWLLKYYFKPTNPFCFKIQRIYKEEVMVSVAGVKRRRGGKEKHKRINKTFGLASSNNSGKNQNSCGPETLIIYDRRNVNTKM